ncbi:carbon monoxide dehydrogenase subunit G [Kyrpidia sp.]|uniref:CoxG family protein n=1 Tax=Kyrpidia sp. TaxID=2073077 RepID=UPI00258FA985|nr:carbon monoxide dehydrogenase subunit G [Kyrpidia sp.]MCL6576143.1 carbon monoxide dehydrogenase subunit G [Kyrpidia sp.]
MRMEDTFTVAAPVEIVWNTVIDPTRLGQCLPGCESIKRVDDTHYEATMAVKIQFMTLRFFTRGELKDTDPPRHLTVVMDGRPIALAGVFRAQLRAELIPTNGSTEMHYELDLRMTGRLASLGEAIMRKTVEQSAREFVTKVRALVEDTPAVQS